MSKKMVGVPYLEESDVNPDGSLKPHVCRGKPVIVMIQGDFCGYCTKAKPDFEKLANSQADVVVVTIQIDGSPSEKKASAHMASVNKNPGVPCYLAFGRDGKFMKSHSGGRDVASLKNFAGTL